MENFGRKWKNLLPFALMACILFYAGITGVAAIYSEPRLSVDESLYDHISSQLLTSPFDYSPRSFWDETKNSLTENNRKLVAVYMDVPLFKHPPVLCYTLVFLKKIFGDSPLTGKYLMLVLRLLSVLAMFFLCSKFFGPFWGALGAMILAADPVYTFCSQKIWLEIPCAFFVLAGVCLLFRSDENKRFAVLSAVMMALALLTKYVAILPLAAVSVFILFADICGTRKEAVRYFTIIALMFAPWVMWNFAVYGFGFLGKLIQLNSSIMSGQGGSRVFAIASISIISLFFILFAYLLIWGGDLREEILKKIKSSAALNARFVYPAVWAVLLVLVMFSWKALVHVMDWKYMPRVSDSMHMFNKAPGYFYFYHVMELSPLLVLAYLSAITIKEWNRGLWLCGVSIFVTYVFFGFFYNESRYVSIATPFLVLLAVYSIRRFMICISSCGDKGSRMVLYSAFGLILAYLFIKTLYIDAALVMGNHFIFF